MKKHFFFGFTIALLCFACSIYAQNSHKAYNVDGTKYQNVESSSKLQISQISDHNFAIHKEIKNLPSPEKSNYQFKLNVEGEMQLFAIGNGDDFFDLSFSNPYEASLPEGHYDIAIQGFNADFHPAFYFVEQLFIGEDTEITVNMSDAVHQIDIVPVDHNNLPLKDREMDFVDTEITFNVFMHPSIGMTFMSSFGSWEGGFYPDLYLYVNDMKTRNRILTTVDAYEPANNCSYFIAMPMIENDVTEDILLENKSEEVSLYTQMFNVSKDLTEDSYSNKSILIVFYDYEKGHGYLNSSAWSSMRVHDRNKPYSLRSNLSYNDNPQTGDINVFITPLYYEYFDIYGNTEYTGIVAPFPMAKNSNGKFIVDFFSVLHDYALSNGEGAIEMIGNNPLTRVWSEDEFYNEGYRTPHLYHQAINFNATTSPFGNAMLNNRLLYLGEFGEQKYNHGDVFVNIHADGMEIFNDSIFILNGTYGLDATYSDYQIAVVNDQVFAYGRNLVNRTTIEFSLDNADANPPTLTTLRVINDGKISNFIVDAEKAHLEITAGDFTLNDDGELIYDKKPNIEVAWSIDGETFHSLQATEDAAKFHPSYGNFFEINLAPLVELNTTKAWVTIKITLTDEAGNKQEQILEPLFHYGDITDIDEILSEQTKSFAYPNPFTGNVNIELNTPVSGEVYFEIYDVSGRIIYQQKMDCRQTTSFTWNGSQIKEGLYFYGIYTKEGAIKGKIIKQ